MNLSPWEIQALLWQDLAKAYAERSIQLLKHHAVDAPDTPRRRELIKVQEAADLLGISAATLYRSATHYPFTVRLPGRGRAGGKGALRFDRQGVLTWLQTQAGKAGGVLA